MQTLPFLATSTNATTYLHRLHDRRRLELLTYIGKLIGFHPIPNH